MLIFKHKRFAQWAKDEGMTDATLRNAVIEIERGLFEADLGGGLYKKRVARSGQGKRTSYRTILAFRREKRAIFIFGFSKNERSNIGVTEKEIFKRLARDYLNANDEEIKQLIKIREILEVK